MKTKHSPSILVHALPYSKIWTEHWNKCRETNKLLLGVFTQSIFRNTCI